MPLFHRVVAAAIVAAASTAALSAQLTFEVATIIRAIQAGIARKITGPRIPALRAP
jgi:hypothetical protein